MVETKSTFHTFDYELRPEMKKLNYSLTKSDLMNAKNGEILGLYRGQVERLVDTNSRHNCIYI